ncbi:MAG: response regulator [Desulfovibrionaceae bacterium]|jgi:two-component system chemotaxis response regulator CheY|nr:response regulator [Desulfovibrionaceae bacterium]
MKILIVDDNEPTRRMLGKMAGPYGLITTAADGAEAVERFERALDVGSPFELVFLDILMPGMDGRTALKEIRILEQGRGIARADRAKIIMVTAMDDPGVMSESFFQGDASGYLVKPITHHNVLEKLAEVGLIPPEEAEAESTLSADDAGPPPDPDGPF